MPGECLSDPRTTLARHKYFTLRPRPLEEWLWKQNLPPSAERVFWLHWQEGMVNGDWCSEIPLKRVASRCALDISSVTRAYQLLGRMGLVRRQDPGRDPSRPFSQAVAITEVRIPLALTQELGRHPNRPAVHKVAAAPAVQNPAQVPERAVEQGHSEPIADPFQGRSAKERRKALGELTAAMSARELASYHEALRTNDPLLSFDADSRLSAAQKDTLMQLIAAVTRAKPETGTKPSAVPQTRPGQRRLSPFELARLRRDIHAHSNGAEAAELLRQVVWSIEEGALRRFSALHAMRIALKKIRELAWTRPNRMPPNWMRAMTGIELAQPESCRTA